MLPIEVMNNCATGLLVGIPNILIKNSAAYSTKVPPIPPAIVLCTPDFPKNPPRALKKSSNCSEIILSEIPWSLRFVTSLTIDKKN